MRSMDQRFHIDWWQQAGFRITVRNEAEIASYKWIARCHSSTLLFSLMVFERGTTDGESAIGEVQDSSILGHHERHAVDEKEAVRWFTSLSSELRERAAASPLAILLDDE